MDKVDERLNELVEIEPLNADQFLQVKETLTRIGLVRTENGQKVLWQSCHVLYKRQRYFIVHFKELYELDGRTVDLTDEDLDRVEYVAALLEEWGLVKTITPVTKKKVNALIVPFKDKHKWILKSKYQFGARK